MIAAVGTATVLDPMTKFPEVPRLMIVPSICVELPVGIVISLIVMPAAFAENVCVPTVNVD